MENFLQLSNEEKRALIANALNAVAAVINAEFMPLITQLPGYVGDGVELMTIGGYDPRICRSINDDYNGVNFAPFFWVEHEGNSKTFQVSDRELQLLYKKAKI